MYKQDFHIEDLGLINCAGTGQAFSQAFLLLFIWQLVHRE